MGIGVEPQFIIRFFQDVFLQFPFLFYLNELMIAKIPAMKINIPIPIIVKQPYSTILSFQVFL